MKWLAIYQTEHDSACAFIDDTEHSNLPLGWSPTSDVLPEMKPGSPVYLVEMEVGEQPTVFDVDAASEVRRHYVTI